MVGVTDESPELVDKWLARAKPSYPIAILRNAEAFEGFLGVKYFPFCAVIDPEGKLAYAGHAGEEGKCLDDALGKARKAPLVPKVFARAAKLMQAGDLSKAYIEVRKLQDGGKLPSEDAAYGQEFRVYLEGLASSALAESKTLQEQGFLLQAVKRIEPFAAAELAFPSSEDSARLIKDIQMLPDYKKEAAGGEEFAKARVLDDDSEYLEAFECYRAISKKYSGTKIGENARKRATELIEEGKPGYESACDDCAKGRRACEKHRKDVKV